MTTPSNRTTWSPPKGYYQVESKLEGFTVFAPQISQKEQAVAGPRTYNCPHCGSTTQYDIAAGGVTCEYCGYTVETQAEKVGRQAQTFEFTLEAVNRANQGWGAERRLLHCDNCGAELSLPENALSITCPFCTSNKVNVRVAPIDQLRPHVIIPFKIQKDITRKNLQEWLGKGWFHPDGLAGSVVVNHFTGIYLPFWTFSADIDARWEAEVGYERTVRHFDKATSTWQNRTEIDWRWEAGNVVIDVTDTLVPGSTHASALILKKLEPYNLNEMTEYNPDFLAGWQANTYDVPLEEAWKVGKETMRERSKRACYANIPTSHVRSFSMDADFKNEVWRIVLLPVYISAYRFEEKIYQVMINGQTGAVAGQKPVAWWKVWLAMALCLLPSFLVGLIGVPLLLAGGVGTLFLFVALLLLIAGCIIAYKIYNAAVDSEAA
jgi:DNA-directed RNA polymerase subunit RPC12/RpoP